MTTKRTSLALLLAGGVAAALLPLSLAGPAQAIAPASAPAVASAATTSAPAGVALKRAKKKKAPKLTISSTRLKKGDTITITGTRFPKKPTSLYIAICANPPSASNCDQVDLRHIKQISYKGKGTFKTKFKVPGTKFQSPGGKINCKKKQCVIGTSNAFIPSDRSYNSVAKFSVRK